jgi:serine/threonine protein kinase
MSLLLKNRYKVLDVLSDDGGFGQTLLAEDVETPSRRRCVIKKLKPRDDDGEYQFVLERFHREAAILERLGDLSDQIPKLYAYFVENHEFYLVQELIEGLTIGQKVKQAGVSSEAKVREFLTSSLDVLDFVHKQNIIHRDIKPGNIIFRQRDDKPVLIDFGIVKEILNLDVEGNPTSSVAMGTPGYSPLEQAFGKPVFASDLFSLGATAIFLLTGKNPQQMNNPVNGEINWRQYAPNVSAEFAEILDKAIKPYVSDRYQNVAEMREDLQKSLIKKPVTLNVVSRIPSRQRSIKFYLFIVIGVLGLLLISGVSVWMFRSSPEVSQQNKIVTQEIYDPYKGLVDELLPESVAIGALNGRGSRDTRDAFTFKEKLPNDAKMDKEKKELGFIDSVVGVYERGEQKVELVLANFNSSKEAADAILKLGAKANLQVGEKYNKDGKNVGKRLVDSRGHLWSNGSLIISLDKKGGDADLKDFELNLPF